MGTEEKTAGNGLGLSFQQNGVMIAPMNSRPGTFFMACAFCFLAGSAPCIAEAPKEVLSDKIATLEHAYESSGFLKTHPDVVITKNDNSLTLTFHAREWLVYGCGMDGRWTKDPRKETGPDSDGMVITVMLDDQGPESEQWAGRYRELNLKGIDSNYMREPYWQTYGCGTQLSNSRIYARVNIAMNNRTDRKLVEEAFAPIVTAFGAAKEK